MKFLYELKVALHIAKMSYAMRNTPNGFLFYVLRMMQSHSPVARELSWYLEVMDSAEYITSKREKGKITIEFNGKF